MEQVVQLEPSKGGQRDYADAARVAEAGKSCEVDGRVRDLSLHKSEYLDLSLRCL